MSNESAPFGVVVGYDGSAASAAAVRWAAREALMRNLELTIVHATAPALKDSSLISWTGPAPSELRRAQEYHARRLVDEAAKVANEAAGGVRIETSVVIGAPVPTFVDLSSRARLIVVGRRGRTVLPGVSFGSISTAMIHHARCPVAVIHDEVPHDDAPVVVGIDGSPVSELATALAFDEASWRGVELVAVHAWCDSDPFGIHEPEWATARPTAEEALAERLAGWQERYPDVRVRRVVVFDQPAQHVIAEAESAQLVVVGTRGHGERTGQLLGSVSAAVTQACQIPVIVARRG